MVRCKFCLPAAPASSASTPRRRFCANGHVVTVLDELNAYYDPALKQARLAQIGARANYRFVQTDIAAPGALDAAANGERYDVIVHLAAQAGVRYALSRSRRLHPLQSGRPRRMCWSSRAITTGLQHLVYASSSSVYGNDTKAPFREDARADQPVSYYGATKRAGELLSHSYAELFGLKQTGLRFFTVYGPWGRPDMAYWSFTDAIVKGSSDPSVRREESSARLHLCRRYRRGAPAHRGDAFRARRPDGAEPASTIWATSIPKSVLDLIRHIETATGKKAQIEECRRPARRRKGNLRGYFAREPRFLRLRPACVSR